MLLTMTWPEPLRLPKELLLLLLLFLLGTRLRTSKSKSKRFSPIFSSLMDRRATALCIFGAAVLQIISAFSDLSLWKCPIYHGLGVPCPGCGLSRALRRLLQGDWRTAMTIHAFAPVLLFALILLGCAGLLPEPYRGKMISETERIERETGISAFLLISLVGYWIIRLLQ